MEKDQIGFYDSYEDWATGYITAPLYTALACIIGGCAGCGLCFIYCSDANDDCDLADSEGEDDCGVKK